MDADGEADRKSALVAGEISTSKIAMKRRPNNDAGGSD